MSPEALGFVLLAALLSGIFGGFPIAFTLVVLTAVFGYIGMGTRVFDLMAFQAWALMKEETLAAVPLFLFMGYLLEEAGLMDRLFRGFQKLFGGVRGSLYLGVLITGTIFAAATGIIGASVTLLGIMAGSAMKRSGYDPSLSAGVITAAGCLGILIPPSVMLVTMGPVVGVSIVKLFAAAIFPGLLLSGLYILYAVAKSYLRPRLAPLVPEQERASSLREGLRELLVGMVPVTTLILAALGSILAGWATPTEAAAMGAAGAWILAVAYRRFTVRGLQQALVRTASTSSMILFLAVASNMYGAVFTRLGTGTWIAEQVLNSGVAPGVIVVLLMLVIFVLGWPLEWPAIVYIFLPIFVPVVEGIRLPGIESTPDKLLWFSTLVAVNLQTAFLSPPVAMAAYYLKAVVPEWELSQIYRGMIEFMILQVVGLVVVLLYPPIALWLPTRLFGGG